MYLRQLRAEDVGPNYVRWMNDADLIAFTEARSRKWSQAELKSYVADRLADPSCRFYAIVLKDGDNHIGNIKIDGIGSRHRSANIGIIIGERSEHRKGFAAEAITALARHGFEALDCRKIRAGCYASNCAGIGAFINAGFIEEGRLRSEVVLDDGQRDDVVLLGLVGPGG